MKFNCLFCAMVAANLFVCGCTPQSPPPPPPVANLLASEPTAAQPRLPTIKLWVGPAEITAELAVQPRAIQTGMMFRTNLIETEGMLFILAQPQRASFWMKNCPMPLSCAYIDPLGMILEIRVMEPHNTNSIIANFDNVKFVLETTRGWFERHGVRTNMVIQTEHGSLLDTFYQQRPR